MDKYNAAKNEYVSQMEKLKTSIKPQVQKVQATIREARNAAKPIRRRRTPVKTSKSNATKKSAARKSPAKKSTKKTTAKKAVKK